MRQFCGRPWDISSETTNSAIRYSFVHNTVTSARLTVVHSLGRKVTTVRDLDFGRRGLDSTAWVSNLLYKPGRASQGPNQATFHEMNISMPIVAAPRPRVASSGGGRGLRFLTARLAQAVADAGLIPVSRAVDEARSAASAKHAVADPSCSTSRPSLLTRRRRSFRFQPVLPIAPGPERESAPEDRLPPAPVFVRLPELRHPRPRRIINRAKMASEAFQQLEAQVQSTPTPRPAPMRSNTVSPPVATHSAPPYPYPQRRRDMLRPADTHVTDAAVEIVPPTKSRRDHDGSAHRDRVAWTLAAAPSGRPRTRSHSHGRAVQLGRGADASGAARRDHARN